ncbi:Na+/H+ antiporter subunit D [Methylobrevis albus]|uniref:Na+/H+ antiporter subunit D n=1 Tax=Methylobrevis albus TaxID=2793297 RepID=A0A931I0I3_9HYPH|nr:Na+/H+ antiporter subunit D [Methylobrevis albus]MBH0237104.1 Na+/H+ antiporter subunit D [Methylobrevis albus]
MATPDHAATAVDLTAALVAAPIPAADWLVILPVLIPMVAGAIGLVTRWRSGLQWHLALGALSLTLVVDVMLLIRVATEGPIVMAMGRWLPPFGISFTADALGATFAVTAAVVALVATFYARDSFNVSERRYGIFPFLLLLMAGVSGAFLTGDLFNLYVWFEVLLISSFGMLVMGSEKAQIDGTIKYAFLNLVATTLFLIAIGLLYGVLGTLNMADIVGAAQRAPSSAPLIAIACLFFFAFAMKAGAFPVNAWLPASYHTPRIVVSALFAGLLTKVGVYALLRVLVMLLPRQADAFSGLVAVIAALTMVLGALGALAQSDFRRMLGYLIISGIGSMLVGVALATEAALTGAIVYAVHSMLTMTALYLIAGVMAARVDGSFDLRRLGGLYGASPLLAGLFLVLGLSVAGLPPFSGFWPKLVLVDASLAAGSRMLAFAILATGFLTTLAVGRVWLYAFWRGGPEGTADGTRTVLGPAGDTAAADRRGTALLLPVLVLAAAIVGLGLWPAPLYDFAGVAARGLIDPTAYIGAVFGGLQ